MSAECKGSDVDVNQAVAEFILDRQIRGATRATLDFYSYQLGPFVKWCNGRHLTLDGLAASDLRLYLVERQRVSYNALCEASARLRTFFRWCSQERLLGVDLGLTIKPSKRSHTVVPSLSVGQVRAMISQCAGSSFTSIRDEFLIRLLVDTGLRVTEAIALTDADVIANNQILVAHGKGRRQRIVYYGPRTARCLLRYLRARRRIATAPCRLLVNRSGSPLNRRHVHQQVARLARRAAVFGVRVSPHTLRHTFATWYLRNGGDVFSLQRQLGHSSLSMTRRYLDLADGDVAAAHMKYSPGDSV